MNWNEARVQQTSILDAVTEINQSGVEAFRASQFAQAARLFRQAFRLLQTDNSDDPEEIRVAELGLLRNLAQTYRKMGDLARAESYYRQALQRVEKGTLAEGHLAMGLGLLNHLRGDLEAAATWTEEALEVYLEQEDERLAAGALVNLGVCLFEASEYGTAEEKLHEALRLFMRSKQKWGLAKCYTELARVSERVGRLEAGLNYAREALIVSADEDDEIELGRALMVSARIYSCMERTDRVESYLEQARALFTKQRAWYELKQLCDLEKELLG